MPRYRSGQTEQSVKLLAEAYIGSNPILGTRRGERVLMLILGTFYIIVIAGLGSSVVERLHGKEEVGSSILPPGSSGYRTVTDQPQSPRQQSSFGIEFRPWQAKQTDY